MNAPHRSSAKAVFLDRDGTIIRHVHYLGDPAGVVLLPRAAEALSVLREAGFSLFLLTNQSGVGRGLFTMEAVHRCNERMIELLGLPAPVFAEVCIAPEHPESPSVYRKPSPRFINECIVRHALERAHCWMVGDKAIDVETGMNAGVNAALIGKGDSSLAIPDIPCYDSLYEFARTFAAVKA